MLIHNGHWVEWNSEPCFNIPVEYANGKRKELWFSFDRDYLPHATLDVLDAALLALLPSALANGEDIEVEGVVSERLVWALNNRAVPLLLLQGFAKDNRHPVIHARQTVSVSPAGTAVGMGFSAGVDSLSALVHHTAPEVPQSLRLTHLVCNNFSSRRFGAPQWHQTSLKGLKALAREIGLPLIRIDSNIAEFCTLDFKHVHSPINLSAAFLLQKLFRRFVYAGAFKYEACSYRSAENIANLDPALVPALSNERVEFVPTGQQYDRTEKTIQATSVKGSRTHLDVCFRTGDSSDLKAKINCGGCEKCVRTFLTLEIIGCIDEYQAVFDAYQYRAARDKYIMKMLFSEDYFMRDIRNFAKSRGYKWPARFNVSGLALRLAEQIDWR